jgi:ABC-type multidrug transport system fused ATPase/permease subunit
VVFLKKGRLVEQSYHSALDSKILSVPQFLKQCSSVVFLKKGRLVEQSYHSALDSKILSVTQFLKQCSSVVFLKKDRLVEQGSHAELMLLPDGHYRHIAEFDANR